MTITPEEIARLREALEIDTEPFLLYRHNLSGMLDEIERLRADLREAVALLRTDSVNGDTFFAWRDRRDALLAKHKEEA